MSSGIEPPVHARSTALGDAWIDDGIVWHRIRGGEAITAEDARTAVEDIRRLTGDRPYPAVVDLREVAWADFDARLVFAEASIPNEPATALLVGPGVSQLIASLFLKFGRPERPIALFEAEAEAVDWVREYRP